MGNEALSERSGMTRKEELLASYDDALSHPWESLESVLKDITEEEASYQHPLYQKEKQEENDPLPGSILWHIVHLGYCYKRYKDMIVAIPEVPPPPILPEVKSFTKAVSNLRSFRAELRECVSSLSEYELDKKFFDGKTVVELIRASIRHDAWHGGQIAVAKRLYRNKEK